MPFFILWRGIFKNRKTMKTIDFLITAKNSETRKRKIEFLFKYKELKNIKHTYQVMIDMIGYTDEQINDEIEDYLTFEEFKQYLV